MGAYINIGNAGFQSVRNGEYVDKSGLVSIVNSTLFTERRFSCVSRSRRFGKSVAAKMLCAYYDQSCDSRHLFADLEIASDPSFEKHLNKYPVIYLDITDFVSKKEVNVVNNIEADLLSDISKAYPDIAKMENDGLIDYLLRVCEERGLQFIFIIDEWDTICREYAPNSDAMDQYLNLLRRLFKSEKATRVFAGVYMTGILPIKKYKTQSALNNFIEYSMVKPGGMERFFGFTKDEVSALAAKYGLDFDDLEKWYDGYQIGGELSMFNPNSVMQALHEQWCESYWGRTGAYDAVTDYISMNYDGLKDDIIRMLAGGSCIVNPIGFTNDLSEIRSRDDVLTVLIHLGYLTYDRRSKECRIPNLEVSNEMEAAVKTRNWGRLTEALRCSRELLQATLRGDEEAVARGVDEAHDEHTSILSYNDENSLACVLSIAYYYATNDYIVHRELASGKGFADLVLIPRKNVDSPAIIIELKYNKAVDTAIDQIKQKNYPSKVSQYLNLPSKETTSQLSPPTSQLLLVGISYNRESKQHQCRIERLG